MATLCSQSYHIIFVSKPGYEELQSLSSKMRSTTVLGSLVSMAVATPQNFGLQGLDLGSAFNNNFGLKGQDSFGLSGLEGQDSFGLSDFEGQDSFGLNRFSGIGLEGQNSFGLSGLGGQDSFGLGSFSGLGLEGQNSFGLSGLEGKDSFGLNGFSEIGQKIEESKADNFKAYGSGDFYGSNGQNLLKNLKNLNSKSFGQNFGKGSDFGMKNGLSFGFSN